MIKLLSKKQVKETVGFSYAHIDRMEFDPDYERWDFPKRVRVGFRVFWVESEIQQWLEVQIANRSS